jgi:hypothetical protein
MGFIFNFQGEKESLTFFLQQPHSCESVWACLGLVDLFWCATGLWICFGVLWACGFVWGVWETILYKMPYFL